MIAARVRIRYDSQRVHRRAIAGSNHALERAAVAIRDEAVGSIKYESGPSRPGQPPHTHTGRLPRSILYAVDRRGHRAVIGASAVLAGEMAARHEYGGTYRRRHYPPRPFMRPALLRLAGRLPQFWANSIR